VMLRIVPSTVLLAAIHYKGIEDGPDYSYVLEFGSRKNWMDEFKDPASKKPSPEDAHPVRWRTLMTNLGINSSDEFELLVAEFLQSGLYDVSKVSTIIDRYEAEHDVTAMAQAVHTFFRRSFWEHRLTDSQCIEEGRPLVAKADLMDAMTATALHDLLMELPGGLPLAEELIKGWVTAFRPKIVATGPIQDFFHRKVHPDIEALFKESAQQVVADTSVVEACKRMLEMSGWGTREQTTLRLATVESFENAVRTSETFDLQTLFAKMLDLAQNPEDAAEKFGSATENFTEACRRIVRDESVPRLARLVHNVFAESKLSDVLEGAPKASDNPSTTSTAA